MHSAWFGTTTGFEKRVKVTQVVEWKLLFVIFNLISLRIFDLDATIISLHRRKQFHHRRSCELRLNDFDRLTLLKQFILLSRVIIGRDICQSSVTIKIQTA